MKHVVFAHRKLSFGGGERVMLERVAALAPLDVRITVIFRKEPDKRDIEPELRARNPHVGDILHIPGAWGTLRWLWKNKPDLLALCNHKGVQRALPWLARLGLRIPTVVTLHEHYERHLRKYRGIRKLVNLWIIDWEFEKTVQTQLGPQPCAMIHPLYPHRKAEPPTESERREAKMKLGFPEDAVVLGYCGQIDARKDPLTTLELTRCIEERLGREVHLIFAGRVDEATRQQMEQAIDRMGRWERTRIMGPVPDLSPVFRSLDAYLMTSRNEGFFPIALIEALEQRVPIVAPSVGGIGTVLVDGEGGILIQKPDDRKSIPKAVLEAAADRVAAMLADPEALELQRQKALALGRRLTEDYDAAGKFREAVSAWL